MRWRDYPEEDRYRSALATCTREIATVYQIMGRNDQAETFYRRAIALREGLIRDRPSVGQYRRELASEFKQFSGLHQVLERFNLAEELNRKALAVAETLARDHPGVLKDELALVNALDGLGDTLYNSGQANRAEPYQRRAVDLIRKLSGDHPDEISPSVLAGMLIDLGNIYERMGRLSEAEANYREALDALKALAEKFPAVSTYQRQLARTYRNLANVCGSTGRFGLTLEFDRTAITICEKLARDHPQILDFAIDYGSNCLSYGTALGAVGRREQGLEWLDRAVQVLTGANEREPRGTRAKQSLLETYRLRGERRFALGRYAGALDDLDRAISLNEDWVRAYGDELRGGLKGEVRAYGDELRALRAAVLARLGRYARAAAEVDALAGARSTSPEVWYNGACTLAMISHGAGHDVALSEAERARRAATYATRAVAFLNRARMAGWFRVAGNLEELRSDHDLDPLRHRADFQALLLDAAFPDQPFAGVAR
jgi:tetratricopeptide (TPR) repeat protein